VTEASKLNLSTGAQQKSRRKNFVCKPKRRQEIQIEMLDDTGLATPFDCYELNSIGVYLYSDLLFSEGETMQLKLTIPSCFKPVIIEGEVVRAEIGDSFHEPGMGVAFRDIKPEVKSALQKYVARRFLKYV